MMLYFCNICSSIFSDYTIFIVHTDFCVSALYEQYNRAMIGLPCNLNPNIIAPDNLQKIVKQVLSPEPYIIVKDEKVNVSEPLYVETNFNEYGSNDNIRNFPNPHYEPLLMIKKNYL
uniref:Unspecified product n=1 Tax=Parastrongyloides trichosuri TaxID=131310 RepID=A0A0N4ZPE2_PARTI